MSLADSAQLLDATFGVRNVLQAAGTFGLLGTLALGAVCVPLRRAYRRLGREDARP